jgi:hypothetical protein
MKHGQEKSDLFIIALKPTNKPGRLGAELVEPRERTEGNMGEQHTYRTLCRIKRVPEARLCTRSCSWDSSLTTRGGSPVRESRPPGSVRGASSNGCPYRDGLRSNGVVEKRYYRPSGQHRAWREIAGSRSAVRVAALGTKGARVGGAHGRWVGGYEVVGESRFRFRGARGCCGPERGGVLRCHQGRRPICMRSGLLL